ncbi:GMC oxidoreductase [Hygrophoropsis aurantiaca]|uniref:GMC oxidoreductase n=1 Tax=Hygrophoropsis aurantiaca TaxID=72124 RepID=A0ACB8ADX9_9AGAM|nr:GMC oxidoreductase [Hygrophoropsis aurantiaca]
MGAVLSQPKLLDDPSVLADKLYDYVIVGGGTAGCVLASRLSEDVNVSVLLVEAGDNHVGELFSKIPVAYPRLLKSSRDWGYKTIPQKALNDRVIDCPRGKIMGGSASINALVYQHCSPSDFDEWESKGATGWNYKALAPYFRKSEKFTPNSAYPEVRLEDRGISGVWQTSLGYSHSICERWIDAAVEVGVPRNPDINTARGSIGVSKFFTFVDQKGQRSSTATAFLSKDVLNRSNLTVITGTMTTRVLFSSEDRPRATGIEIAQSDSSPRFTINAGKEVILAAGAINSPQLLMISGVGDRSELEKLDIPVVKDLPHVGKNLLDHVLVPIVFRAKGGYTLDYMQEPLKALPAMLRWLLTGTGTCSSNGGEAALFVRLNDKSLPFATPESESRAPYIVDNTSGSTSPDLEVGVVPASYRPLPKGENGLTIVPILLRPLSVGSMWLSSSSPFKQPNINPNFLSNPSDIKSMIRGIRLALHIGRAAALKTMLNLKDNSEDMDGQYWPGDADPDKVLDEDLEKWVRNNADTVNHCSGTARIGNTEKDGVVDAQLRVFGVDGLRVVDASVFPTMVSGHPTAPIVAIAEKASDMILNS